ncbi:MAG: hypothetical protein JWM80_1242 [Cyanobacteria bacterium RYN_339]|nr:hypothetical protein [Cyanobacteria bacterium RYN_339]
MRRLLATATVALVLAGCGTHAAPTAGTTATAALQAQAKKKTTKKIDKAAFDAGVAAANARINQAPRQGVTKPGDAADTPVATPVGTEPFSFQLGYATGLLQGGLNAYNRINGSFDVYQWKMFAYMVENAEKDALSALRSDSTLATKAAVPAGILEGGIRSFDSINGSFDVYQWQSFADSNRNVLKSALGALQAI